MAAEKRWTVGFPLYQGATLLDFAGATQIFAQWVAPEFEPVWLAPAIEPVRTSEGVEVMPSRTFAKPGKLDVIFVPGGGEDVAEVMQDPVYTGFLRHAAETAQLVGSVCVGAFIVAAAGLFDDREATTYWSQRENLALFPHLRVAAGYPRWVFSGNRFSGGGVSSSIDLALELVDRLSGATASQKAQLAVQYAPSPPFHSGDPAEAPPEVTTAIRSDQKEFIAKIRAATLAVIGSA